MGLEATNKDLNAFLALVKGKGLRKGAMDFLSHDFTFSEKMIEEDMLNIQQTFVKDSKNIGFPRDRRASSEEKTKAYERKRDEETGEQLPKTLRPSEKQQARKGKGQQQVEVYEAPAFSTDFDKSQVKKFAAALTKKLLAGYKAIQSTDKVVYSVTQDSDGTVRVYAAVQAKKIPPSVYTVLAKVLSAAQKSLREDFKEIFYRAAKGSPSDGTDPDDPDKGWTLHSIVEFGHKTSVAETHKHIVDNILNRMSPELKDSDFGKNLTKIRNDYSFDLPISLTSELTVDFKDGVLTSERNMEGDIESYWKNVGKTAGAASEGGQKAIKDAILDVKKKSGLLQELADSAKEAMAGKSNIADKILKGPGSIPFNILFGGMFTQLASIKRLRKKRWVRGGAPFTHKPKSHAPITKTANIQGKGTHVHHEVSDLVKGFGTFAKPAPQRPAKTGDSPAQTRDFTRLTALINQKLGQKVLGNMGHPGLVNRTGTFANSVRVNSITPTGSGVPSIDYTYQRDPYEVFDLERGKLPWATASRDPTTLIDKSIREIAAEMAITKLTTRRL